MDSYRSSFSGSTDEISLTQIVSELEELRLKPAAVEPNIIKMKEALNTLCRHEAMLDMLIGEQQAGRYLAASSTELQETLEDVRTQIAKYMDHIKKIPHQDIIKARQEEREKIKVRRELEDYDSLDELERRNSVSFEPLPFRPAVAPSRIPEVKEEDLGPPEIPPDEIVLGKAPVGSGAFGGVWPGTCRGKRVAVKIPTKQILNEEEMRKFQQEVKTMSKIFHPNVVLLMGATKPKGPNEKLQIVMEWCETDLEKLLKEDRKLRKLYAKKGINSTEGLLTMIDRVQFAKDTALGMNWLHGICSIVHGDLKSANLLLDSNRRVKVSDFGFSVIKKPNDPREEPNPLGTPLYMAPEVMMCKKYDGFKADVYAFGLILWEIVTSQRLFAEFTQWRPFKKAIVQDQYRPPVPEDCPDCLKYLMTRCWDDDPDVRPSFHEIVFRLDECLVDVSIQDPEGRKFWKDHFLLPTQELLTTVPWYTEQNKVGFKDILAAQLGMNPARIELTKSILAVESEVGSTKKFQVPMLHFHRMVATFGHFFVAGKGTQIMEEIISLTDKQTLAEKRLKGREPGYFLMRLRDPTKAESPGHPFVFSHINSRGTVDHKIVKYEPDTHEFKIKVRKHYHSFKSLHDIIKIPKLLLRTPCPPDFFVSPYSSDSSDEEETNHGEVMEKQE